MIGFLMIAAVLLLLLLVEQCLEAFYKRTNDYKKSLGGADRFHRDVPCNLEIANIGSGPGLYAISYDRCDKKGFNFSTAPQSYKYGFRLLRRFRDHIKNGAIIIIIIMCPLSFGRNLDYDRPGYSDKFYGVLPKEDIDNYSLKRVFLLRFPLLIRVTKKMASLVRSGLIAGHNMQDMEEPGTISAWKKEFDLHDLKDSGQASAHKPAFEEKINILRSIIEYCRENTWRPLLVIPPMPENVREYISQDFLEIFVYGNLRKVLEGNGDVRLMDYYADKRFSQNMFQSGVFMNGQGRELFSGILFHDIGLSKGKEVKRV